MKEIALLLVPALASSCSLLFSESRGDCDSYADYHTSQDGIRAYFPMSESGNEETVGLAAQVEGVSIQGPKATNLVNETDYGLYRVQGQESFGTSKVEGCSIRSGFQPDPMGGGDSLLWFPVQWLDSSNDFAVSLLFKPGRDLPNATGSIVFSERYARRDADPAVEGAGFRLGYQPEGDLLRFRLWCSESGCDNEDPNSEKESTNVFPWDRWYHLTMSFDSASQAVSVYVDGKLEVSGPFPTANSILPSDENHGIGSVSGLYSDSLFSDVAIYARTRTADEVQSDLDALQRRGRPSP